ncbi:MAG TPA: TetR family transcriptional regulator, partial [Mycobacteriales bacterium]|nr:TetR family transcriptional regulator [Mycobacteriales bacterium]
MPATADDASIGRAAKGERTRARLLDAARETFAAAGWARTRVEDVCRTAGVG